MRFSFSDITAYRIIIRVDNAQRLHCIPSPPRRDTAHAFLVAVVLCGGLATGLPPPCGRAQLHVTRGNIV